MMKKIIIVCLMLFCLGLGDFSFADGPGKNRDKEAFPFLNAPGLSKREFIAAIMYSGLSANLDNSGRDALDLAKESILRADILLKTLEETKSK